MTSVKKGKSFRYLHICQRKTQNKWETSPKLMEIFYPNFSYDLGTPLNSINTKLNVYGIILLKRVSNPPEADVAAFDQ